jgi:uncharacterized protein involved in exopolysaccharide biosynthesis
MEENQSKFADDEVDLVDILVVIIRRKWVILGLLIASVVLSGLYVVYDMTREYEITYQAPVLITPPQVYKTTARSGTAGSIRLETDNPRIDRIYPAINNGLHEKACSSDNGGIIQHFSA